VQISTINWDDFRLFLELVRSGSARGAAQALGVSHSTIVRRVERLEKSLGATLFDRDFTGYRPTAAGEALLESAETAEQANLAADRQLRGKDAQLKGGIRLTTPDILASYFLVPELRSFKEAYSQIELSVLISYDVYDLARREADVAIRVIGGGRNPPEGLIGRKLGGVSSCYYATESYLDEFDPWSKNSTASWIGWGEQETYPAWVKASPFPNVPVHGHFNNAMLQVAAAQNDLGLATLPCFVGDVVPGIVRIPGCEPFANYDVWMLSHPDLRDAARHRTFRSFIVDLFQQKQDVLLGV
jgi:DNA-binding transcriptional LysR family regulator